VQPTIRGKSCRQDTNVAGKIDAVARRARRLSLFSPREGPATTCRQKMSLRSGSSSATSARESVTSSFLAVTTFPCACEDEKHTPAPCQLRVHPVSIWVDICSPAFRRLRSLFRKFKISVVDMFCAVCHVLSAPCHTKNQIQ
jgi:hypothetical protein